MKKFIVLSAVVLLCYLETMATLPRESIRMLGLDSELAGIVTDHYTDIFTINPYYFQKLDSKMLIVEPNRLDFNGRPKLFIGMFAPGSGSVINIGNSKSPGTISSVTGGTLDLDNNWSSDTGSTSGETLQQWDDGFVPAAGRGSAVVSGGTADDRIFDRSKKTTQSGEYNTYANEFNLAQYWNLFGVPNLMILEYQGRTIPNNASKIEEDKNETTGEIIKRQTTDRFETSSNNTFSAILKFGYELIKTEKKNYGIYFGFGGEYQSGLPITLFPPTGGSYWLYYDKDSKTTVNNDWDISISTGPSDNYYYQTKIQTQNSFLSVQIGNNYVNQISEKTKLRAFFNIGYSALLFSTNTINGSLSDAGAGGGISTLSGSVSEGAMYDWMNTGDIYRIKNNEHISNAISQSEMNLDSAIGVETNFSKNLLFATGIKLNFAGTQLNIKSAQNLTQNSRYDQNGDGDLLDSGDREKIVTDSNKFITRQVTNNFTLNLPAGFEIRVFEQMVLRFGARHVIKYYRTEISGETTADGLQVTTTKIGNGTSSPTETIIYSNTATTKAPGTTLQETIDQDNYINAGFGLNLSNSLMIDVKMSTNNEMTNLGNWYISGTYKF